MPRFIIDIDPYSYDADAPDDADLDALAITALASYARDAGVTFTDIAVPVSRDRAFGVRVAFTATDDDARAYCAYFDCDTDELERVD